MTTSKGELFCRLRSVIFEFQKDVYENGEYKNGGTQRGPGDSHVAYRRLLAEQCRDRCAVKGTVIERFIPEQRPVIYEGAIHTKRRPQCRHSPANWKNCRHNLCEPIFHGDDSTREDHLWNDDDRQQAIGGIIIRR